MIYNCMLEIVKTQYEDKGTFPSKHDLDQAFKGQNDHVPATIIQMLADRLTKSLKRFLAAKELDLPDVGFPRFKQPNRWHSIQLRQYGDEKNRRDVLLAPDYKHVSLPKKLGGSLKIKLHRPIEGTPKTAHLVYRADGHWYILIVCETAPSHEHASVGCSHPDIGLDVGLKFFLTDSEGNTVDNPASIARVKRRFGASNAYLPVARKGAVAAAKPHAVPRKPISRLLVNGATFISRSPNSTLRAIIISLSSTCTSTTW